ncbi:MAG: trypsin-like peptidase domain-containing protein [Actinomycetota bacterium]|nr:trypsin-like peptidase domain-containing protein [Actinomycetota bacterium]
MVSGVASALVVSAIFLATDGSDGEPAGGRPDAAAAASAPSLRDVYRRARLGVVLVEHRPPGVKPRTGPPRRDDGIATGSGFVLDRRGYVVTNQHVVAGRGTTTVQFGGGEDPVRATIVGRDPATDLALVRLDRAEAARLRPLRLADSGAVRIGDPAIAIGNPFGLERSLSVGVVSGTGRRIDAPDGSKIEDAVQTDAPINPGNSGGPLLDARGRVIGVISQGRGNGVAFAVPVDTVKRVVADLRVGRRASGGQPATTSSAPRSSRPSANRR